MNCILHITAVVRIPVYKSTLIFGATYNIMNYFLLLLPSNTPGIITANLTMITSFFAPKKKRSRQTDDSLPNKRPASSASSTVSSSLVSQSPSSSTSSTSAASSLLMHFPTSEDTISWRVALKKVLESKKFENLAAFVEKERCVVLMIYCNAWHNTIRFTDQQ